MKSTVTGLALLCLLSLLTQIGPQTAALAQEEDIVTPGHTKEEFRAKARIYQAKAASYRREAEKHLEAAKRFREDRVAEGRPANSAKDIQEMDRRCKALSDHALVLAKDAELLAQFYERHAVALEKDAGAPAK